VFALPEPGFGPGQRLPVDIDALVGAHVETINRRWPQTPVVLCGHSSGGLVAHAVAGRLEDLGRPSAGVVLIDTYWLDADLLATTLRAALATAAQREAVVGLGEPGVTRLTAMGGYLRILADWTPTPLTTPTLLVRAREPFTGPVGQDQPARWRLPHVVVEVPGNHFSMMAEHAGTTSDAIEAWVATLRHDDGGLPR
jgi:thioesterase domain-containing protein